MAKKTTPTPPAEPATEPAATENGAEIPVTPPPAAPEKLPEPKTAAKKAKMWSFPTVSRCPRCGALDTQAYSTKGPTQYRRCRRAICRNGYAVRGKKV